MEISGEVKNTILVRSPFGALPEGNRRALLALSTVERLPRRYPIVAQGAPTQRFVIIGEGRVKLERAHGERSFPLGHRGPGQMVGETAAGGAEAATETATVVDDVEALSFSILDFRAQLAADASLRAALAGAVLAEQRAAEERLLGLLLHPVEARLASFLLAAGARWGRDQAGGRAITAPFTHAEIAALIGSTRETVTLVLGKLKREGLLAFDRRKVTLLDLAALERRARSETT